MQQSKMFMYDQEVLKTEHKQLTDRNTGPGQHTETFKTTEAILSTMILKLDQIQSLNDQAKKNEQFKEKLH